MDENTITDSVVNQLWTCSRCSLGPVHYTTYILHMRLAHDFHGKAFDEAFDTLIVELSKVRVA